MKIVSWNVNGIRAVHRKGTMLPLFESESPDIICLQETKAWPDQLPKEIIDVEGYSSHFTKPDKKGYSGVALYTKSEPRSVNPGFGIKRFDQEGRVISADYGDFILFNVYFPNGGQGEKRLMYKLDFYEAFLKHIDSLVSEGRSVIVCGDVNTAHTEIDLARPAQNVNNTGFLPEERAWIDKLIVHGYADTFRMFESAGGHYTWWDYKTRARERNVGWRLDYFFVSEDLRERVESAKILSDVPGSDHCPVTLKLKKN